MVKSKTIVILICATSVLTLSVTTAKTDGTTTEPRVHPVEGHRGAGADINSTLNTTTKSEKNLSKDNHEALAPAIGIPIRQTEATNPSPASKAVPEATVVAEGIQLTSKDLLPADPESKVPKIRTASVVARKGVIAASKISARKGVGLETSISTESSIEGFDEAVHSAVSHLNTPSKLEESTEKANDKKYTKKASTELKSSPVHVSLPAAISTTTSTTAITSETPSTSGNVSSTIKVPISEASTTASTATTKRFKPKPTVTIGEMDIDKPIPASPTKTPPLGMPRKIDYIVPVIITIMALPLLGGAAFFLYRRGRDCWDKRHYRRMDFLIDGMYNDYSWK